MVRMAFFSSSSVPASMRAMLAGFEIVDAEVSAVIQPVRGGVPASQGGLCGESGYRVFVTVLRHDVLAGLETDRLAGNLRALPPATDEVHLDAARFRVPDRAMAELLQVEGRAHFSIEPAER